MHWRKLGFECSCRSLWDALRLGVWIPLTISAIPDWARQAKKSHRCAMLAEKSLRFEFCQVTESSELDFPIHLWLLSGGCNPSTLWYLFHAKSAKAVSKSFRSGSRAMPRGCCSVGQFAGEPVSFVTRLLPQMLSSGLLQLFFPHNCKEEATSASLSVACHWWWCLIYWKPLFQRLERSERASCWYY